MDALDLIIEQFTSSVLCTRCLKYTCECTDDDVRRAEEERVEKEGVEL